MAEVRRDLESKVISGARGLIAREDALGVSEHTFEPSVSSGSNQEMASLPGNVNRGAPEADAVFGAA